MKKVLVGLIAGGALLTAHAGFAQVNVTVDGTEATRVVIAPPESDIAKTIKTGLKSAYDSAQRGTRSYRDARELYYFYGQRHFEPLWVEMAADGAVTYSDNAEAILEVFRDAHLSGLKPSDYLTDAIDIDKAGSAPSELADFETAFSSAVMRYAQDTHGGRIDPRLVSSSIDLDPRRVDEAALLDDLASGSDPARVLHDLEPDNREYVALKKALKKYYDGTAEEPVTIPGGETLHAGMTDSRVPLIRERLGVTAPADANTIYGDDLVAAIEKFQQDMGLIVDGVTGPATVAALNGGAATSKGDIIANMERWRWMPEDMGDFHVMVNIPEFRLYVMDDGLARYSTRVVVGKTKHKTPVFSDEIEHVVVNPYWNVPSSIASNEIAPQLVSNPGYIASNNMELLFSGRVVDARSFDWSATDVDHFRIRQRPGAGNALGTVKFLFPNSHNVYLHDTPSKSLFARSRRSFSHGCVRVQNPWEFADALMSHDPELTVASLESQRGSSEKWNNLSRHIPVHLTYFTLRVDVDGTLRSYSDIYGHNEKLKTLLGV